MVEYRRSYIDDTTSTAGSVWKTSEPYETMITVSESHLANLGSRIAMLERQISILETKYDKACEILLARGINIIELI